MENSGYLLEAGSAVSEGGRRDELRYSPVKLWAWYAAMGPLALYGRLSGRCGPLVEPPAYGIRNSPAGPGPIVAFGDSLTAGFGVSREVAFPAQLSSLLQREVVNAGISAETSAQGLARLQHDVLNLNPAVVLIGFGGNDLVQRIPQDECFACIREIVERVQATGAVAVLLGIRGSWLYRIDYHTPFVRLAVETGAVLVPSVLDGIWGKPWLMRDIAHPNARGYTLIAQRVAERLRPHLS
jgi:lysophospholipase L1-like esterase